MKTQTKKNKKMITKIDDQIVMITGEIHSLLAELEEETSTTEEAEIHAKIDILQVRRGGLESALWIVMAEARK